MAGLLGIPEEAESRPREGSALLSRPLPHPHVSDVSLGRRTMTQVGNPVGRPSRSSHCVGTSPACRGQRYCCGLSHPAEQAGGSER